MKKPLSWLVFSLLGVVLLGASYKPVSARVQVEHHAGVLLSNAQLPDITPMPTASPVVPPAQTPEDRTLPPVGSNAGLVLGASLLVLIIIGGVLGSRRQQKH